MDRIFSSNPVNATAGFVVAKGIHWDPEINFGNLQHWDAPPQTLPMPDAGSFVDLSGKKFGRFTVIGYLGKPNKKKKAKWLVRCSCGDYEARTSVAINNPANAGDMCKPCLHLAYIKRRDGQ